MAALAMKGLIHTHDIGYSGFTSRECFSIAWGWTHTQIQTLVHTHERINFPSKRNFMKPDTHRQQASTCLILKAIN